MNDPLVTLEEPIVEPQVVGGIWWVIDKMKQIAEETGQTLKHVHILRKEKGFAFRIELSE